MTQSHVTRTHVSLQVRKEVFKVLDLLGPFRKMYAYVRDVGATGTIYKSIFRIWDRLGPLRNVFSGLVPTGVDKHFDGDGTPCLGLRVYK